MPVLREYFKKEYSQGDWHLEEKLYLNQTYLLQTSIKRKGVYETILFLFYSPN